VVSDAIFGLNASTSGSKKLQSWAVGKATDKNNMIWRTVGMNQKEVLTELDIVISDALSQYAARTDAAAWT
jgi:hypothetical protein